MDSVPQPPPEKKCSCCKTIFPATVERFGNRKDRADGLNDVCKSCNRDRANRFRNANPEKVKAWKRRYYTQNKLKIQERQREFDHTHPELKRQRSMRYILTHKAEHTRRGKDWKQRNKERVQVSRLRRIRREMDASGTFTPEDIQLIRRGQGNRCWYCSTDLSGGYHIDHFIPLSKGGTNEPGNLRLACPSCNLKKNDKDPHLWSGRLL